MSFSLSEITGGNPYGLNKEERTKLLCSALSDLTKNHYEKSEHYRKITDAAGFDPYKAEAAGVSAIERLPMLPVRLFKEYELRSIPREEVVKTMTSSGTSGQAVSKIYLDKENVRNQTLVLSEIIGSLIGKKRLPMLILDTDLIKKDRAMFSARGAGIVGLSMFGREHLYVLDENMELKTAELEEYLKKHEGETILLFGFTFMIWQHIVAVLRERGVCLNIANGVLFHMGGWKKLQAQAVDSLTFNAAVREVMGNVSSYNYYGMVEQLGSIFFECEHGHMHCSIYSDVIIRRHRDFSAADIGEKGVVEVLSLLPTSYPGHILLTEDEGEILGEDDCPCGRLGKYFKIHGRIPGAEIRGCSDTYEKR
ncbi:MAG: acyl-protein synthetase [Oscillospiraceae bacterium]|jgi:hypothetical protein|nr:acyl-protein synthetase [Oscillospiraceae bacterium]